MNTTIKAGIGLLFCASTLLALSPNIPALPPVEDVFTVGFDYVPKAITPYFSKESFMKVYPTLIPADVRIAVGVKRYSQSGVIVTNDKKVLFWTTCAPSYICVVTESGQSRYYATTNSLAIE